jgi:phage terminase Nu1 subunit (DNA packaging protein)
MMTKNAGFDRAESAAQAPLLVGRRELARLLSVSERSVTNYLRLGMPSLILGGRRLFDPHEVVAWIRQQQQKPAE